MENNDSSLFELQIDQPVTSYLSETAKWGKFLAIIGFIGCGLFLLVGIFAGSFMASLNSLEGVGMSSSIMMALYIGLALLYFFPCLYLFNFATKMQKAIRSNDQIQLTESFKNLKSCYKFMGILMIIILALYGLIFIGGIIIAAMSN
jgi:Family of unknown function (DUF5362)